MPKVKRADGTRPAAASLLADSPVARPDFATLDTIFDPNPPAIRVVNRGRNTGAGPAFVYWDSPGAPDVSGAFYGGSVPFGQLADIVGVGTFTG